MKLPSEIETPLDRRAMTIDILAAEIERKNRTIKAWRMKYDESESQSWKKKYDQLKVQIVKLRRSNRSYQYWQRQEDQRQKEINEEYARQKEANGKDVEEIK